MSLFVFTLESLTSNRFLSAVKCMHSPWEADAWQKCMPLLRQFHINCGNEITTKHFRRGTFLVILKMRNTKLQTEILK